MCKIPTENNVWASVAAMCVGFNHHFHFIFSMNHNTLICEAS